MADFQEAKARVSDLHRAVDTATAGQFAGVLRRFMHPDYLFRGVHPLNELRGVDPVAELLWESLYRSLGGWQRRQDVFMAGCSETDGGIWVCSMGHLLGLLDKPWLGIPATGKLVFVRYAEFHRVHAGCIAESGFFCDLIGLLEQVGLQPLSMQTGAQLLVPGPRTHDGLLFERQSEEDSHRTLLLVNRMRQDLREFRQSDRPLEVLARTWHQDMLWFGPAGIGSTYTIGRYHAQHQAPFRSGLADIHSNGHVCRMAEGMYASWFGWPNLTLTPTGGFLGLPGNLQRVDMRVVDVYRRAGEKLAENWIFIDLLHWLLQQGVDVLGRIRSEQQTQNPTPHGRK